MSQPEAPPLALEAALRRVAELEAELAATQERCSLFQALVENSIDVVTRFSADCRHIYVSPAIEPASGLKPAFWIGKSHRELGFPAAFVEFWESNISRALTSGEYVDIDFEFPAPEGTRYFQGLLIPEIGESGRPETVLSIVKDVTDRKQTELALRASELRLLHAEKMAGLGQLVAGVAHELKNPITFIKTGLYVIQSRVALIKEGAARVRGGQDLQSVAAALGVADGERFIGELDDVMRSCSEGVERTIDIVNQLRMFSRVEAAERKALDLGRVIENSVALVRPTFEQRIRFEVELAEIPPLFGVSGQLGQLAVNLITNACQAIPGEGTVRVSLSVTQAEAVLRVSDTGVGMSEAVRRRIFDPFYTSKPVGEGTGLGLSICHSIVADHGGAIRVESTPGVGSLFEVHLPLSGERT